MQTTKEKRAMPGKHAGTPARIFPCLYNSRTINSHAASPTGLP
jgi:hypothetical protein